MRSLALGLACLLSLAAGTALAQSVLIPGGSATSPVQSSASTASTTATNPAGNATPTLNSCPSVTGVTKTTSCVSGNNELGIQWSSSVACTTTSSGIKLSCRDSNMVLLGVDSGYAYCIAPKAASAACDCADTNTCACIPSLKSYAGVSVGAAAVPCAAAK